MHASLSRRRRGHEEPAKVDGPPKALTRVELAVAVIATLTSMALHGVFIQHSPALWRDEVNSLKTASAAWPDLWRLMEFESFPPLWDVALGGWLAVGGGASDTTLRIGGAIGGLMLLGSVWFAVGRLGRAVPLVSLSLLAVNPEVIRWGASLRPWSLGAAFGVVMIVLTYHAAIGRSWRVSAAAMLIGLIAVQTIYQNAILLTVAIVCAVAPLVWQRQWGRATVPIGIGAICLASLLPYAGIIARRADWDGLSETPITVAELGGKLWEVLTASGQIVAVVWCLLPIAAVVLMVISTSHRSLRGYACSVVVLGVAALMGFYLLFRYPTQRWYYLPLAVLVAVAFEIAIAIDRGARHVRFARVGLALIVLLAGTGPAITALRVPQTTMNVIAGLVDRHAESGDLIVVSPWYYAVSFTHYYRGGLETMTIPPLADVSVHRYDLLKKAMCQVDVMRPVRERIQQVLSSGHRIWLVGALAAPAPGEATRPPAPPPLPRTRWNSSPYEEAWILEIGEFLTKHTKAGGMIPLPMPAGSLEVPTLAVMQGWR